MTTVGRVSARDPSSLGRRLSTWLALQGLLASLIVSAAVYVVSGWILNGRQIEELQQKQGVVQHALVETAASADVNELKHRLDDFLAGHEDMTLSVSSLTGSAVYQSNRDRLKRLQGQTKLATWLLDWPADASGQVRVELRLHVGRDDTLLNRLGMTLLLTSLTAAAIVSVTGFLLVSRGLRPVRELAAQVELVGLDHPQIRLDGSAQPRELLPLVDRFNALLSRVERAYAQLEAFNADVAHELRTPLTTLIGASELALRRDRPAEELREVIAANLDDLRRLAGIVNDMLFLSQADRGAAARRTKVESLAASVGDILDYHEAALQDRNLAAACEGDASGAFDVALLRRALSNLLSNASRYASPGSLVKVRIAASHGRVRFAVENEGSTIAQQELPKLFDRFYRVERSRQQFSTNYGLGLAIVAAIARMHGGEPFALSDGSLTVIGIDVPQI